MEGEEHKWIYEISYIWIAENDMEMWLIIASYAHSLSSCEIKACKEIRPDWEMNPWLLYTDAVLCQLSYQANWELPTAQNWPLCAYLSWSIISSYHSLWFKYMNFHTFIWKNISWCINAAGIYTIGCDCKVHKSGFEIADSLVANVTKNWALATKFAETGRQLATHVLSPVFVR